MATPIAAETVSRTVLGRLRGSPSAGRVLASFDHACDLLTEGGDVVALVTPQVGSGPLNVVVDDSASCFASLEPGMPATLDADEIQVGELEIGLGEAAVWEPRPDWADLRARRAGIVARLPVLRLLSVEDAPAGSLLSILEGSSFDGSLRGAALAETERAVGALMDGWIGDLTRLREGAAQLAGLGGGLTPSGDDFLTGVMVWAWLAHPAPSSFCQAVVEAAAPLTTTLSAAFLGAAARGECDAAWHDLLYALAQEDGVELPKAAQDVLAHGVTSGADALAGFLWTGTQIQADPRG